MLLKELAQAARRSDVQNADKAAEERVKNPDGSYVGLHFDEKTKQKIMKIASDIGAPIDDPSDLHTTVMYTLDYMDGFKPVGNLEEPYELKPVGFDLFGPEKNALVLKLDCPELSKRHEQLKSEYGVNPTYPEYKPHVTLSYDWKGEKPDDTDLDSIGSLYGSEEYYEDLQTDWAEKNGKR